MDSSSDEGLEMFRGWPALRVLKVCECSLFGCETRFDIPSFQDIEVKDIDMELANASDFLNCDRVCVHYMTEDYDVSQVEHLIKTATSLYSRSLVDLRVETNTRFDNRDVSPTDQIPAALSQLLGSCNRLQTLHLHNEDGCECAVVTLGEGDCPCLTDLVLDGVPCDVLDLCAAHALTSVSLSDVDYGSGSERLSLPSSLRHFYYKGRRLFTPGARHELSSLSCLTTLCLSVQNLCWQSDYQLPLLPSTLQHFHIFCPFFKQQHVRYDGPYRTTVWRYRDAKHDFDLENCDWDVLDSCTELERLTLPFESSVSGRLLSTTLKAKIEAARHIHIVKYTDVRESV